MSFDDGDNWQSLQLNLPTTSVRDFEVYGNDLVVGTHGRGFWVIDDIGPLRQITDTVARADAYLFKPADAVNVLQGSDNGTPTQKDEPQAANPPNGASIDYYLKTAATGPVTIEIQDAAGACLALFASDPASAPACAGAAAGRGAAFGRGGGTGIPNTSALWRPAPVPFAQQRRHASDYLGARRWRRSWRTRERGRAAGRPVHGEADRQRPDLHADVRREAGSTDEVRARRRLTRQGSRDIQLAG